MNVRVTAPVDPVQNPGRERRAKIAMQSRHLSYHNTAAKSASHDKLRALPESFDEKGNLPEIIGEVGVAHNNPLSADVTGRVDISAAQAALRSAQDFTSMRENGLRRLISRAIDDQNLTSHSCSFQALLTPIHKLAHRNLFVQGWDDNADLNRPWLRISREPVFDARNRVSHDAIPRASLSSPRSLLRLMSDGPASQGLC